MNDPRKVEPPDNPHLGKQVDQLLSKYVGNPQSPQPEEVRQMAAEFLVWRRELEAKIREQRDIQKQLETYRDRYVDLYDFAPLGYVTLDEEGYIQEINLAGARLLGGEVAELVGYPLADYVLALDRAAFLEHLQKCCSEQQEVTSELGLIAKDGRLVVVQLRTVPVKAMEHEGIFCKTAIADITDRKRAEEAIQEERNLLRTLIDNLPDPIYVKDTQGRFVAVNLAAARITGATTPSDLLGKTDYDFYPVEVAAEYFRDEQEIMRSGKPLVNKDEPHLDRQGDRRTVLTTKVPLKDSRGTVVGLVGISRDITERKQVEETLQSQRQFLEAVLASIEAGIVACDANGVLTLFNRATREFHGLPQEPLLAEQWADHYDLYLPDGKTRMRTEEVPLFRALQGEHLHNVEMVIVPKNGPARTILASGQPLYDTAGQKTGAVVAMHDITERKQPEKAASRG